MKRVIKPRGSCRRCNFDQIEKLVALVIEEDNSSKEAALITGINLRTLVFINGNTVLCFERAYFFHANTFNVQKAL
jgi:hypothetical protein